MAGAPPLPLEKAQAQLLAQAIPLTIERVDIGSALGRYLAEPLVAVRTQPPADLSAMDGYAVLSGDLAGPWQVIGESAAGHPYRGAMARGQAVRISTGALIPDDADAVIVQEDVLRNVDQLSLTGTPPSPEHKHIRRKGMDFQGGAVLFGAGIKVGPAHVALALSAGHNQLAVRRKVRIAIIDSGDELAVDPRNCATHQIPASNGAMLDALVSGLPCQVTRIGPVGDDLAQLAEALALTAEADIIVTSGGASVGDHDLIRPALAAWGAKLDFWKVAIKPGKPLIVASKGQQIVLGLPGNPVSNHVTAFFFLLPLIRVLAGSENPLPRAVTAQLSTRMNPGGDRREYLRGLWDGTTVSPDVMQDSGALAALARSNALIERPAGAPAAEAGSIVRIYLLENGGNA
jgi:molybdopterin molybdotransferase